MFNSESTISRMRTARGALVGAVITAGLAAGGLGAATPANATCASFSGINLGSGCTSKLFGVAIGIGAGATANAGGLFSTSFAIGKAAAASTTGALDLAVAAGPDTSSEVLGGFLNIALAAGGKGGADYTQAQSGWSKSDFGNIAVTVGNSSYAFAGGPTNTTVGAGNVAVNLGTGNDVESIGFLNGALSVGGKQPYLNNYVVANGVMNSAANIGGNINDVTAGTTDKSTANSAFNVFGSNNVVSSGPGPLALAGSLFKSGTTVTKEKLGVNINGVRVPNTAASVPGPKSPKPAASRSSAAK